MINITCVNTVTAPITAKNKGFKIETLKNFEVWFVTGSQHLYGKQTLKQVDADSKTIAGYLNKSAKIPCKVIFKPVVTTPEKIFKICIDANTAQNCIGLKSCATI